MSFINEIMVNNDDGRIFKVEGPFKKDILNIKSKVYYYTLTTLNPRTLVSESNPARITKNSVDKAIEEGKIVKYNGKGK